MRLFSIARFWIRLLLIASLAASAHADFEPSFELVLRRPAGTRRDCWDVDAVRARIAHYMTRTSGGAPLRIELDVSRDATVEMQVFQAERRVARRRFVNLPKACVDRRDVVAVSIALTLDQALDAEAASTHSPSAAHSGGETPAPPDASGAPRDQDAPAAVRAEPAVAEPAAAPTSAGTAADAEYAREVPAANEPSQPPAGARAAASTAVSTTAKPRHAAGLPLQVQLGIRGMLGALPSAALLGAVGVGIALPGALSAELTGFASTLVDSAFAGGRAQTRLVAGELVGCYSWRLRSFAAQGCAGAAGGVCLARGRGFDTDLPQTSAAWGAGVGRIAGLWPATGWIRVRVAIQGQIHVIRPGLRVEGAPSDLRPALFGASAGLDLILRFD